MRPTFTKPRTARSSWSVIKASWILGYPRITATSSSTPFFFACSCSTIMFAVWICTGKPMRTFSSACASDCNRHVPKATPVSAISSHRIARLPLSKMARTKGADLLGPPLAALLCASLSLCHNRLETLHRKQSSRLPDVIHHLKDQFLDLIIGNTEGMGMPQMEIHSLRPERDQSG